MNGKLIFLDNRNLTEMIDKYTTVVVLELMVALVSALVIYRLAKKNFVKETIESGRFDTLDGVRGIAATMVAIHHSFFFYGYATFGIWSINYLGKGLLQVIVDYMGKASVSLFFMITAFLFWGKVLDSSKGINWQGFYIKRFFRIFPLYFAAVFLSFSYVIITTKTPFTIFPYLRDSFYWLTFDFISTPNINGFPFSGSIVAGVFWSLSYEWIFYFLLPMFSVFAVNKRTSFFIVSLMFVIIAFIYFFNVEIKYWTQVHVLCFIIGGGCAHINKYYPAAINMMKGPVLSAFAVGVFLACIANFDAPYSHIPSVLIGISFLIISSGNSIFGVLSLKFIKMLGTISFSIYMLHGLVFTVLFSPMIKSGVSFQLAATITIPVIIAVSTISYIVIERPFIDRGRVFSKGMSDIIQLSKSA
ncbi:acyltransferase [Enterobacter sp. CP102]|uniref:acyltransferase family protein n=1 Tax=Enterobacter sp. CP102 TaxID=2976431 RepID=UPI00220A4F13|nr:acyltransferase [Enterobacter sp. CP102]UWM62655.1 acyltransferase [Enterobacter sp. CP102]